MKFYLKDKNYFEKQIIDNVLCEHHIKHKIIKNSIPVDPDDIDFDIDEEDIDEVYVINYDIMIDTSLEILDYIKWVIDKRIKTIIKLNKNYYRKVNKKKVSKKKDDENETRATNIRK